MKKRKRKLAMAILGSTIAVYLFFRYLFFVFFPIILALGVGKILMPAIRFLKRKCHLPRVISVVLPVTFFFCFFVVALYYLVGMLCGQLVSIAQNSPYYQEIINTGVNQICNWCDGIFFVEEGTAFAYFSMQFNSILEKFSSDGIPNITLRAFQILKKLVGWAGTFGVVIIVTCMVVKDMEELRQKYRNSIFYEDIHALLRPLTQVGFAYAKAQGIIIFLVACVCVIGFYLTGSNYALLFGIFVAVFDAFPMIGSGLILVPAAIVALLQKEIGVAAVYLTMYLICQLIRQFLEPKLIGEKIGIHPFFILLSVYFGMKCFGISGVILGPASLVLIQSMARLIMKEEET